MELLWFLGMTLLLVGIWLLFLVVVGYGWGIGGARQSGWVVPGMKISGYVDLRSPRLARLLVSRYSGYSTRINTNIGILLDRFQVNQYPDRISYLGIFDWCVSLPLAAWWAWEITRYFWVAPLLEWEIGNGVPAAGLTLGFYRMVMHFAGVWNNIHADFGPVLTKEELKALRREGKL